jgi:putative endonuclease
MNFLAKLKACFGGAAGPEHLRRGKRGERAAKRYLQRHGMKFLTSNFRSERGEIDLVFRLHDYPLSSVSWKGRIAAPFLPVVRLCADWGVLPKRLKGGRLNSIRNGTDCLVFIEVKTRSSEQWGRPASAVDAERRWRLTRAGLDYLRLLGRPAVKVRFDIVEVLLVDGAVAEIRHLPNAFPMERPYRYG